MRKLKMVPKTDVKNLIEREIKELVEVLKDNCISKDTIRNIVDTKKSILAKIKTLGE